MKFHPLIFLFLIGLEKNSSSAQAFLRSGTMHPDPSTIITDQYAVLRLTGDDGAGARINSWDSRNPYTYIEVLTNVRGEVFHILYQTGFTGKIVFLGVSKNLESLLLARDKPQMGFKDCLGRINQCDYSLRIPEVAIDCIMNQLRRNAMPK